MRIKLDENLPGELVDDLRSLGHDVDTVALEHIAGSDDTRVAEAAKRRGRVLFTLDKGLGDIRRFPPPEYPGIVVFRFDRVGRGSTRRGIIAAMPHVTRSLTPGRLLVVTPRTLRAR